MVSHLSHNSTDENFPQTFLMEKYGNQFFVITMPIENLPYGQSPCAGARRSSDSVRAFQKNFQYMNTASEYRTMTEE